MVVVEVLGVAAYQTIQSSGLVDRVSYLSGCAVGAIGNASQTGACFGL